MKIKNIAYTVLVILLVSVFLGCTGKEQPEHAEAGMIASFTVSK